MFGISKKAVHQIGLDIRSDSVRMIQLANTGGTPAVVAAEHTEHRVESECTEEQRREKLVQTVKRMLARGKFTGRDVVSTISSDVLVIKSLRLDTADPRQIEEELKQEVAERFGLESQHAEIRYLVAGNVYQGDVTKNEIIVFGVDNESVSAHLAMIEEVGLNPVAIEALPCALFRSFQSSLRRQEDQDTVTAIIEIGPGHTVVVIGRGQEMVFVKQIPVGGDTLNAHVAARLDVAEVEARRLRSKLKAGDDDSIDATTRQAIIDAVRPAIENLANEISLCFRYYAVTFRGQRPENVILAGAEAGEKTILNALRRQLGVDITIAQPLKGFDLSEVDLSSGSDINLSEWAVAAGLGMKRMKFEPCGVN
jgi:type IV pilus assembly protein PilM